MPLAAAGVGLEGAVLSAVAQTEEDEHARRHSHVESKTRSQLVNVTEKKQTQTPRANQW